MASCAPRGWSPNRSESVKTNISPIRVANDSGRIHDDSKPRANFETLARYDPADVLLSALLSVLFETPL